MKATNPPTVKIHARTVWCPNNCTFERGRRPSRLRKKNLSASIAQKFCPWCKLKIDYIRTDTPEGRAARTKQYYEANVQPNLPTKQPDFKKEHEKPLTAAERMRNMRNRRKAELIDDAEGNII